MTYTGPTLNLLRRTLLIADVAILVYLFALMVPIIPVQVFISTGNCSLGCPLITPHDKPAAGGFTVSYLYSITRQLTGFGARYNIDEGYVVPSGPWIVLILAAIACFVSALLIRRRQRAVYRRFV